MQAAINAVIGIKRKSTSSGVSNNIEKGADAVDVPVIPISDDVTIIPTTDIPKEDDKLKAWPEGIKKNFSLLCENEISLVEMLLSLDQHHLFADWDDVGVNDEEKHNFFVQISRLHASYPSPGGLMDYIVNARKLLEAAKNGDNPLDGFRPEVPTGVILEPFSEDFAAFESIGMKELKRVGFVLVAGGLGERLGYSGIKVELPSETTTGTCYMQLYCEIILAIQHRHGQDGLQLPLAIMTSDDTYAKTIALLEANYFFGLQQSQVTIMKQEKVAAINDNMAHLARSSKYEIESKPHGHGDVHALMYSTGTASSWLSKGISWAFFFQDTNGLAFFTLAVQLGVSLKMGLDVNSMTVPRVAKQAVGAITRLVRSDGWSVTANVEYNQLDPLLRANGSAEGDVNDSTGFSPFPGNINQLLLALGPYVQTLSEKHGIMSEFVNPKYADKDKSVFKKPTRLECMMQDYPKSLQFSDKVGFTQVPAWLCFSPCKNNVADAAIAVGQGIPANSAYTAESDQYYVYGELLRRLGAAVSVGEPRSFLGVTCNLGPRIVIKPSTAIFPSEISRVFPQPQRISISSSSCLVVEGAVVVKALHLDGAARFRAVGGSRLAVAVDEKRGIRNTGQVIKPVLVDESDVKDVPSEVDLMRGYVLEMVEERVECPPDDMDHVSHNPGVWVFNGQRVIPEAAYEDSVSELNSPSDRQCTSCLPSMC